MATLYVRNFPDDLRKRVRDSAAKRRRSVGAEVVVLIDQALEDEETRAKRLEALARIDERRRRNPQPEGAIDTLSLLREDRER